MRQQTPLGIALAVLGIIYLIKPDLFQKWFWKRTAISQRLLTPEQNKVYMRVLGLILLGVGIYFIALASDAIA